MSSEAEQTRAEQEVEATFARLLPVVPAGVKYRFRDNVLVRAEKHIKQHGKVADLPGLICDIFWDVFWSCYPDSPSVDIAAMERRHRRPSLLARLWQWARK